MWCVFLGPPSPCQLLIPKHAPPPPTPLLKVFVSPVSATSLPRRRHPASLHNDDVSTTHAHTHTQQVGDLGHTLFATLQSEANPIPKPQQQQKQEGDGPRISGSDVLWALQRASARKKMQKQERRKGSSSAGSRRQGSAVDYQNVRPLCIKSEWGAKLDELEKRLRDLSGSI